MMKTFTERVKAGARRLRNDRKPHDEEATVGENSDLYSGDPSRDARRGNFILPIRHLVAKHSHFTERSAETVIDGGDDLRCRMITGSQDADIDLKGAGDEFGPADLNPSRPTYLQIDEYHQKPNHLHMCKTRLREESRKAYNDQKWYIPVDSLESVLSAETVRSVLIESVPKAAPETIQDYVSTICGIESAKSQEKSEFRKVLAILILSNKSHQITDFIDKDLSDNLLPFLKLGEERSPYRLALKGESEPMSCFDGWTDEEVEEFDGHQWEVLAPFFARGPPNDDRVQQYELHYKRPLPFTPVTKDGNNKSQQNGMLPSSTPFDRAGGHGRVMRIKIHSAHHKLPVFSGEGDESFALKHLFRGSRTEFEHEVEILARLSTWRNPHFVKLLITVEISSPHAKDLYLMFPWADSDLMQLWRGQKATDFAIGAQNPITSHQSSRWVARQCYGLAQALNQLHNLEPKNQDGLEGANGVSANNVIAADELPLYGVHGDIKPQNILWYRRWDAYDDPLGLLQLADFGTGAIHRYISKSDFPRQEVQGTYRPPELDLLQPLSRSIDIWSLGCVFLEFLTWLVRGWEDGEFANKRMSQSMKAGLFEDTFFEIKSDGPKTILQIHDGVVKWIKDLHQHPRCTRYVHHFLDLISTQMLVIEPKESRLIVSDNKPEIIGTKRSRINSEELRKTLGEMFQKGENDPDYFSKPTGAAKQMRPLMAQGVRFSASKSNLIQRRNTLERRTSSKSVSQSKKPTPSSTFDTRLEKQ